MSGQLEPSLDEAHQAIEQKPDEANRRMPG
jgi:hypothetical protein